jgi:hypothetical protein
VSPKFRIYLKSIIYGWQQKWVKYGLDPAAIAKIWQYEIHACVRLGTGCHEDWEERCS